MELKEINQYIRVTDPRDLHDLLFPRSQEGDFAVDPQFLAAVEIELADLVTEIEKLSEDEFDIVEVLASTELVFVNNLTGIGLNMPALGGHQLKPGLSIGKDMLEQFERLLSRCSAIRKVLRFGNTVKALPSLERLLSMDIEKVPKLQLIQLPSVKPFSPFPAPK